MSEYRKVRHIKGSGPGGDFNGPTLKSIMGNTNGKLDDIKKIVEEYDIDGIVIGNPINMDGTEGPSSQSAKDLAKNLSKDITENITLWDERLSSQGAFNLSNDLAINSSKKVKKLDENSAQFILQGILDYYHKKNT